VAERRSRGHIPLIRLLYRLISRDTRHSGEDWPRSVLPLLGHTYVVADGLGTYSHQTLTPTGGQLVPWLEIIEPLIQQADPAANICGFSYTSPGKHYGPVSTDVPLRGRGQVVFRPYAPTSATTQHIIYVGFSRGAVLLPLGLCAMPAGRVEPLADSVPAIVLIQPAVELQAAYLPTTEDYTVAQVPASANELLIDGALLRAEFTDCLGGAIAGGVKVFVRYWPHDRFLAYPDDFIERLRATGVDVDTIDIPPTPGVNPFIEHARVSENPATLQQLQSILQQL